MDADEVDASNEAHALPKIPDAFLALSSYTTTLGFAAMGGMNYAHTHPWMPLALLAKALADAAQAARRTASQPRRHHADCFWRLLAAAATFATVPLAIPEALAAWRQLRR